jgi:hypothetical protein
MRVFIAPECWPWFRPWAWLKQLQIWWSIALWFARSTCESSSTCPRNGKLDVNKRLVGHQLHIDILCNSDCPHLRTRYRIKLSIGTGIVLSKASSKRQFIAGPNATYLSSADCLKYVEIIFWRATQISAEYDEIEQCLSDAFENTIIDRLVSDVDLEASHEV